MSGWPGSAPMRRTFLDVARTPGLNLLLVDDADRVLGTPVLARLVAERPAGVRVVIAGRRLPALGPVTGRLDALGSDQLRMRTWEVEALVNAAYADPLPPGDIALLTRRTGGWVHGLHLFEQDTRGRPLAERRAAVTGPAGWWSAARGYVATEMLADVSAQLRDFLVRTSVFTVPTAQRCDRLLDTTGSARLLDELAQRHGLSPAEPHPVLRAHLAAELVAELGEAEAARLHRRAGRLLAADGAYPEALGAYTRAGDRDAVRQLLAEVGRDAVLGGPGVLDELPGPLVDAEPWLVYARARQHLAHGRLPEAAADYRRAEGMFADPDGIDRCRREFRLAATWLPAEPAPGSHWSSGLRAATRRHPTVGVPCRWSRTIGLPADGADGGVPELGAGFP